MTHIPVGCRLDVVQFCNGNCSVAKIVVPSRKGKQEHVKSTNNIQKNMIKTLKKIKFGKIQLLKSLGRQGLSTNIAIHPLPIQFSTQLGK